MILKLATSQMGPLCIHVVATLEGGIHPGSTTVNGECNFGWGGLEQSLSTEYDILTDWNEIIP